MTYARVFVVTICVLAASLAEAATATWDRNPESNIGGYILSYGTQPGQHTVSIDVGNVTTYQFFPPPGRYYVVVQAYDTNRTLSPKSDEVILDLAGTNRAPSLQQPSNQTTALNAAASLQLVGSDPDGGAITYSAAGLPPGLSVNRTSGLISGTANTAGNYTVTASVSDGSLSASRTFTWTVGNTSSVTVSLSPIDSTLNINDNNYSTDPVLYAYTWPSNSIANAIVMKFDLSQIPANATINSASLQLSLIGVDDAASDPLYTMTLHQIINRNPDLSRATGRTYDGVHPWSPSSCCHDGIPLAQADISPARASLAVDRALGRKSWDAVSIVRSWYATPASNFGLLLNSDGSKPADRSRSFASMESTNTSQRPVLVINYTAGSTPPPPPANKPPTLTQPANQSSVQNTFASLTLVGSDPEGATLRYSATGLPAGVSVNAASGVISGTPTAPGSHSVTASVSDGSLTASRTFTWTVTPATTTATVKLSPIDSTLNLDDRSYASDQRLYTYTWPTRKIANAIVMKFDLSQIPKDARIDSATLQLTLIERDSSSDPTYTVTLHQVINKNMNPARATGLSFDGVMPWTANNCCHQKVPLAQSDISPARATLAVDRSLGAKTWNAIDIVKSWMATPATNFGLLLNSDPSKGADRYRYFASMEHATVSARPFLQVTYTTNATAATQGQAANASAAPSLPDAGIAAADPVDQMLAEVASEGDEPLRADFDGDGVIDGATFRAASGEWRLWLSSTNFATPQPVTWGQVSDRPMPADYDGDGRADLAVYRPSTGRWHVLLSGTGHLQTLDLTWGGQDDQPLAFDVDKDGRADLALPTSNGYLVLLSGSNYTRTLLLR